MKKLAKKVKDDNEKGARISVIEDLFYDFNRTKSDVYKMNFFRGIFFGLGSVLGGTILVALVVWILSAFVDVFPPLADFVNGIIHAMQQNSK